MKNHPSSFFRLLLAGFLLFSLGTSFTFPVNDARYLAAHPVAETLAGEGSFLVSPDPAQAYEPTELRVILANAGGVTITRYAQFYWSAFGIGQSLLPIGGRIPFDLPALSQGTVAAFWVPPDSNPHCFYVDIFDAPAAQVPIASFQHNVRYLAHPAPSGSFGQSLYFPLVGQAGGTVTYYLSVSAVPNSPTWNKQVIPAQVTLGPGQVQAIRVDFSYVGNGQLPPGGIETFTVSAMNNQQQPVGSVSFEFGPPLRLHMHPDPFYSEGEISVDPYPVQAGVPTQVCAEVRNVTEQPQQGVVTFLVAPFGIGQAFSPIDGPQPVVIPELGLQRPCITWIPPFNGLAGMEARVETTGLPVQAVSQRVIDSAELLLPGTTSQLTFPVRNPTDNPAQITLSIISFVEGWTYSLSQDVFPNMQPGQVSFVTLEVQVPQGATLPPEFSPVVDIEGFIGTTPIGGFRKVYHSPVPVHQPSDPIYAEREITVVPYPPQAREPTEICVEIRNPTDLSQTITVDFGVAEFGIGLPWHAVVRPITVQMTANSIKKVCITWVPPYGGRFGVEIGIQAKGHERVYSQRVIDVGEILLPNQSSQFTFPVGNPFTFPITVRLSAIRYLPQWQVTFQPPELQLEPGASVPVTMTILPVQNPGDPEPHEGEPVIDVEAYYSGNGQEGQLLGGFRKLFFPPVPIHRPENPPYAEEEINILPYPPQAGEPTKISFLARNPTAAPQQITVTFEVGNLGIGLPFTPIATQTITLPAFQSGITGAVWVPPLAGEFCVQVKAEAPFFSQPFFSSRNISIVRLPKPYGPPEVFQFAIGDGGIPARPLTIQLGLKPYLANWQVALDKTQVVLAPGQSIATAILTLTPPANPADLPEDGGPVADVSAFVNGQLIGGIRKVWRPPVPLGQLGEPGYAESEISIHPDPPVAGQATTFAAQVRNTSDTTRDITVQFGWANFGMGIAFSNAGVTPTQTQSTLTPGQVTTVSAQWTPQTSGNYCVQISLKEAETGAEQLSRRNVNVIKINPAQCQTITKTFTLSNPTSLTITVTIGASSINLPPGWAFTVTPSEVVLKPGESVTVTVMITPPCILKPEGWQPTPSTAGATGSSSPSIIRVEGYDQEGNLVGGIELQLTSAKTIYLPTVRR